MSNRDESARPSQSGSSNSPPSDTSSLEQSENTTTNNNERGRAKQYEQEQSNLSLTTPSSTAASMDLGSSTDVPSELFANGGGQNQATTPQDTAGRRTVHGHTLPSGWTCKYDPDTDHYSFEFHPDRIMHTEVGSSSTAKLVDTRDREVNVKTPTADHTVQTSHRPTFDLYECKYGYHFPTSPTSSMISELAKQVQKSSTAPPSAPKTRQIGYGKNKLVISSNEDEQTKRLHDMFPTATIPVIEQMIKIYHGREGLIKAALISLGYKRATEYNAQQSSAQSPIMLMMSKPASKKLFDKLVSYFPDKDETLIKTLMYKHKEVEHEIISALVETSQEGQIDRYSRSELDGPKIDKNGAIMKLRYLKFLYPTCEEIELYHLLHCNDLNVLKVTEEVEKKGHKRANIEEVMQNRKSQTQQMRAQQIAHAAKDKAPSCASELVNAHRNRPRPAMTEARVNNLKQNLRNTFANLDDGLLLGALEASDYNEGLAKKFLEEMEPVDDSFFRRRYKLELETKPNVVAFPCKAIQKGDTNFMSIIENEYVCIPKEVIECDHALALLKVDASTFTEEDFEPTKFTHRLGRQLGLAVGPRFKNQTKIRESSRKGIQKQLHIGSKYKEICAIQERPTPNKKAIGCNRTLVHGRNIALNCGHNQKLLQRTHPFFQLQVRS